jgi:hypothetical protein
LSPLAATLLLFSVLAILATPRRWAPLPLLVGACYITRAQGIDLGPFTFTILRILVAVGLLRVLFRREWTWKGNSFGGLDYLIALWGLWAAASVGFHDNPSAAVVNRLGIVFDGWGLYFLFRCFCRSQEELANVGGVIVVALTPIAFEMVIEKATARNFFAVFGGVSETPAIRDGRVRAQGPFGHAILAGNIGAVALPFVIGLWRLRRVTACVGIAACAAMIFASTSSGPILSALAGVGALCLWRYRMQMRRILWAALAVYIALEIVMEDPAYFIMARLDLTGSSTGWHRARLIQSAFQHLSEWWLAGTDYTRHWMPSGVSWSPNHTDITNHYLRMGVLGGVPVMLLFIAMLVRAFWYVGVGLRRCAANDVNNQLMIWACGASLFAHSATCLSVSYFDQSILFLYLTLAATVAAARPSDVSRALVVTQEHPSSTLIYGRRSVRGAVARWEKRSEPRPSHLRQRNPYAASARPKIRATSGGRV